MVLTCIRCFSLMGGCLFGVWPLIQGNTVSAIKGKIDLECYKTVIEVGHGWYCSCFTHTLYFEN